MTDTQIYRLVKQFRNAIGFINSKITFSGTIIFIVGFCIAIVAIIFLEDERKRKHR